MATLILSILRNIMISSNRDNVEGGAEVFQRSNILLRARRKLEAMILSSFDVKNFTEFGTPNIAIPASGRASIPITSEIT